MSDYGYNARLESRKRNAAAQKECHKSVMSSFSPAIYNVTP
jgi:hypothetical protein